MAFRVVRACRWLERRVEPWPRHWDVAPDRTQGLLLRGFERLACSTYLLVDFASARAMGRWLGRQWVDADDAGSRALNVALSYRGVQRLQLTEAALSGFDWAFREGMTEAERARRLGDVAENSPETWRWGGPLNAEFDAAVMLFATCAEELARHRRTVADSLESGGGSIVHELPCAFLPGQREHFGFRGGIAQPYLHSEGVPHAEQLGLLGPAPEHNRVAPGEFLLGYTNEFQELPPSPLVAAGEDPHDELPVCRERHELRDLGRDGSYLVLRQLAQDVHGFWKGLQAQTESAAQRDLLAAKLVGRWPSGAPLVLSPDRDRPELASEDAFGYSREDAFGERCPFGSHIRRANPRDWRLASERSRATQLSNQHRIIRRSRPYGAPLTASFSPDDVLARGDDGADRGLLFACFSVDLARQFEMIQEAWLNDSAFCGLPQQIDPLAGSGADCRRFSVQASAVPRHYEAMPRAVRVEGGAYFFLPSIPALRFIASRSSQLG